MKIEIGETLPGEFRESWPGQYTIFSHFEFAAGIPQALFAITTLKENGLTNVTFHSWSCFQGGANGYYALLPGIAEGSHAYQNILRDHEFCLNFLSARYYDALLATVRHNGMGDDELAAAGLSAENAQTIKPPRIRESFLCLECGLLSHQRIQPGDRCALFIGKVRHLAMDAAFANGLDRKYSPEGFMYNVHSPLNLHTGECGESEAATLNVEQTRQ